MKNYYYWIDTNYYYGDYAVPKFAVIRGEFTEEGTKDRDTEVVILWAAYEDADINPETADFDQLDAFIESKLGFLPEYEIN